MKPCMVTSPLPIFKSKGKYCKGEKPLHVYRVSLSHVVEIGLKGKCTERKTNKEFNICDVVSHIPLSSGKYSS